MIVYLQQYPLEQKAVDTWSAEDIEKELRNPSGLKEVTAPGMKMSMIAFSPDCGWTIESDGPPLFTLQQANHLTGVKQELIMKKDRYHLLGLGLIVGLHLIIFRRQIRASNTPSDKNRISSWTIYNIVVMDSALTIAMAILATSTMELCLVYLAVGIGTCAALLYGVFFFVDLCVIQSHDTTHKRRLDTNHGRNGTNSIQEGTHQYLDTGSIVVLASNQNDWVGGAEEPPPSKSGIFARTLLSAALILLVSFYCLARSPNRGIMTYNFSPRWRANITFLLFFIHLNLWSPQIGRNAKRNCRKALRWEFVIGESILRLVPAWYAYCYSNNLLGLPGNDQHHFEFLVGSMVVQVCCLISQSVVGPRWWAPKGLLPAAYDYHRIIKEDDETASIIRSSPSIPNTTGKDVKTVRERRSGEESKEKSVYTVVCAICMTDVQVPILSANSLASQNVAAPSLLSRAPYMVAPCGHVFHSKCLETQMRHRLQCPVCRETLPAL
jgi:hypothetical protein